MPDTLIRRFSYDFPVPAVAETHLDERKAARQLDNLRFLLNAGIDGLLYIPEDLSADEFH